jgi:hypothetical protein
MVKQIFWRYLAFKDVLYGGIDLFLQHLGVRSSLDGAKHLQRQEPGVIKVHEFHKLGDQAARDNKKIFQSNKITTITLNMKNKEKKNSTVKNTLKFLHKGRG